MHPISFNCICIKLHQALGVIHKTATKPRIHLGICSTRYGTLQPGSTVARPISLPASSAGDISKIWITQVGMQIHEVLHLTHNYGYEVIVILENMSSA